MMAFFKLAFIVFIAYQSSALARGVDVEGMANTWDNMRATGDCCQDCTQIFELLVDLLSNTDVQNKVKSTLEKLCDQLPGPDIPKLCHDQIEKYFPLAMTFLTSVIKPGQVCHMLGLCGSQSDSKQQRLLISYIQEGLKAAMTIPEVQATPHCTFCIYLIKTLESLLPKERTEDSIVHVLGHVCSILPSSVRDQCEGLIERYGKLLLDMLLGYATPQAICTVMHICKGREETPVLMKAPISDCDSCLTLAVLTRLQLGSNTTELQTSSFLGSVCKLHPNALYKCESFTQRYGHQLRELLGKQEPALDVCVSFCQKFAWK